MSDLHKVQKALQRRYGAPAYALFFEVADKTGSANRYADAMAMALWPSRGLKLLGFEIKVDRRDWLRELKNPAKAEAMARLCNEWWVVTTEDVIQEGELPEPWGWLLLGGKSGKLHVKKKALVQPSPQLEGANVMARHLVASLLRRAHEARDNPYSPEVRAIRQGAYEEGLRAGRSQFEGKNEIRALENQIQALKMQLRQHEDAQKEAGLGDYRCWDLPRLARHVKMLERVEPSTLVQTYKYALQQLDHVGQRLREGLEKLEEEIP